MDFGGAVQSHGQFQIQIKAAHVHVDGAKQGKLAVHHHAFGVQQAAREQGDLHTVLQQHAVIRL